MNDNTRPVFYDPDQKRWPRFRRGLFAAALAFSILAAALVFGILINPVLPALDLPSAAVLPNASHLAPPRAARVLPESPRTLRLAKQVDPRGRPQQSLYELLGIDTNAKLPNPEGLDIRVTPTAADGISMGGRLKEIM